MKAQKKKAGMMMNLSTPTPTDQTTLNPQQQAIVDAPIHQAIQVLAGAGTGKTTTITHRYIKLLKDLAQAGEPNPADRILVLTFTEAAAATMRSKILDHWPETIPLPEQDWIGTFHSMCLRWIKRFGLQAGLAMAPQLLDSLGQTAVKERLLQQIRQHEWDDCSSVLQAYELTEVPADCLSLSSLEQSDQAMQGASPTAQDCLETLWAVIDRIKTSGLSPAQFHHVALSQSQRFSQVLPALPTLAPQSGEPFTSLTEAFSAWQKTLRPWVDEHWNPIAMVNQTLEAPKESDYKKALGWWMSEKLYIDGPGRGKTATYTPLQKDWSPFQSTLSQERVWIDRIAALYALYQDSLKRQGLCDFDDLINGVLMILDRQPSVVQWFQAQYAAIIVDEFQDTNASQLRLLQLIMRPTNPAITVVGDEKQSIYGFRYAQPENLNLIFTPQSVDHAAEKPIDYIQAPLSLNYRSHPVIIEVANAFVRQHLTTDPQQHLNAGIPDHPMWAETIVKPTSPTVHWVTFESVPNAPTPTEASELALDLDMPLEIPRTKASKKPSITTYKTLEAQWISEAIEQQHHNGTALKDIAVLSTAWPKAVAVQQALHQRGIPAVLAKPRGLFRQPIVKTAMALIKLLQWPGDDRSLLRLLQTKLAPWQLHVIRLTQQQVQQKRQAASATPETHLTLSLLTFLKTESAVLEESLGLAVTNALQALAQTIETAALQTYGQVLPQHLTHLMTTLGLRPEDDPSLSSFEAAQAQWHLMTWLQVVSHLAQQQDRHLRRVALRPLIEELAAFESDPSLDLPIQASPPSLDAVTLMTIHGSKGLEFPTVYVAMTEAAPMIRSSKELLIFDPQFEPKAGFGVMFSSTMPSFGKLKRRAYQSIWHGPRQTQEVKRLLYVALTRAQHRLILTRCPLSPDWTALPYQATTLAGVIEETL